jgi:chemotaxis protein MotB
MSAHRRRRGGGHGGEFHVDERWMASYMDMVTVLMCLFIVLYAMSTVDQKKFEQLANSLATGFGAESSQTADTAEGVVVPPALVDAKGQGFTDAELAQQQVDQLTAVKQQIDQALLDNGAGAQATAIIDEDGLTVGLVGEDTFFNGNSAVLRGEAQTVLSAITPTLATLSNQISVEGHADPNGSPAPFATDWDLSAARSTAVLRYMVESGGVDGTRISSVSYGSTRPSKLVSAKSGEENRRVDIVIHTTSSDQVNALIPGIVAALGSAAPAAPATAPTETTAEPKAATTSKATTDTTTAKKSGSGTATNGGTKAH